MKRVAAILFFVSQVAASALHAQVDVARIHMEKANQLYLANDFAGARDEYLKITGSGYESSELFYNLGNTYYKLGQIAPAILYYERSLLLNPGDEDTRFNLTLANQLVVDKINPVKPFFITSWIQSSARLFTPVTWGILSIGLLVLLSGLLIYVYATRGQRLKKTAFASGFALILLILISLFLGTIEKRRVYGHENAIVFVPTVTAKSAPENSGTDLFVIHEGLKVQIKERVGDWIRIRIPDGNEAWLPANSVERI